MASRVLLFAATVLLLKLVSTEALKCYSCRYISTLSGTWQNASCTEPFNSTGVSTCEGTYCVAVWANFTSTAGSYMLQRTCTNDSTAVTIDQCEELGMGSDKKYFVYENRCCLLIKNTSLPNDNRRFDQMTCGCRSDNCNGDVPYPVMSANSMASSIQSALGFIVFGTTVALWFIKATL